MTNNSDKAKFLIKKWELLWNHYKLQNESMEKRRNFLWIIQAALFYGWYLTNNEIYMSIIIVLLGVIITISWVFVIKRDMDAIYLTEQALRDVEYQWNKNSKDVSLNRFIVDRDCLAYNKTYEWPYSKEKYDSEALRLMWYEKEGTLIKKIFGIFDCISNFIQVKSVRAWLTWIVPSVILLIWLILSFITLFKFGILIKKYIS